jgi:hypothetical protein
MAQQPIVVINSVENLKMGTSVEEGQIKVRIAFDCKMKSEEIAQVADITKAGAVSISVTTRQLTFGGEAK